MPGTASTALPSFSRDQHHKTDAAKWKGAHSKRVQVLNLAHDSVFGCHLGKCKIRERVRLLEHWPGVCQSMHSYVRSCISCQLRSRPMKADPAREV